jgi:heat shock protein HslJ
VLAPPSDRVQGFTGCNRMARSFEQDADRIRFKGHATTGTACSAGITYVEARFLDALNAVASQQIIGESLELRDAAGRLRMRLESHYLP